MLHFKKREITIAVPDAKLFCRVFDEGNKVPVIVIHGGPGLGQDYLLPHMAAMAEFSSPIFYDQRGAGQSTSADHWQAKPFETYVDDIHRLQQAFGFKKIALLSHSWGSILASAYALAYPDCVEKIMYVNPVPVSSKNYLAFVEHRKQIVDANKEVLEEIKKSLAFQHGDPQTIEKYYRIYFKSYFANPVDANKLNLLMSPEAAINNFKIYDLFYSYTQKNHFDFYHDLTMLNKPSLIIACDQDVIPMHYMYLLHECISNSKLTLITESGHFPYIDQPETLFAIIRAFL